MVSVESEHAHLVTRGAQVGAARAATALAIDRARTLYLALAS